MPVFSKTLCCMSGQRWVFKRNENSSKPEKNGCKRIFWKRKFRGSHFMLFEMLFRWSDLFRCQTRIINGNVKACKAVSYTRLYNQTKTCHTAFHKEPIKTGKHLISGMSLMEPETKAVPHCLLNEKLFRWCQTPKAIEGGRVNKLKCTHKTQCSTCRQLLNFPLSAPKRNAKTGTDFTFCLQPAELLSNENFRKRKWPPQ